MLLEDLHRHAVAEIVRLQLGVADDAAVHLAQPPDVLPDHRRAGLADHAPTPSRPEQRRLGSEACSGPEARALRTNEAALPPNNPIVAIICMNLAGLLQEMGDYKAARPLYEAALQINEAVFGASHPIAATSLIGLGGLLSAAGEHTTARLLYERALTIRETALGPEHPDVAAIVNNLAVLRGSRET